MPAGGQPERDTVRSIGGGKRRPPARNGVRRRYLALNATRWLPTGLLTPVVIVLMTERGLSLAMVGIIFAAGSAVILILELPTGGLADVLGRRPVLLVASLFNLAATLFMAFAEHAWLFTLAWVLEGVYRALESGPLDAWYVDETQAVDPDADIESGLAARGLVLSVAIGAGALIGGALALVPAPGLPTLALPLLVAAALRIVDITALWTVLIEHRPCPDGRSKDDVRQAAGNGDGPHRPNAVRRWSRGAGVVRPAILDTRRTIQEAMGLLRSSAALAALAGIQLLWGVGIYAIESLSGPRLTDLLGDPREGVLVLAVAATIGWGISGFGSAVAPWLARATGSWVTVAIAARIAQGAGVLVAAVVVGPAGILIAYLSFYLVHGAANVAHYGLMHRHVSAAHRTTMHSVNSLTSRLGIAIAAPPLGALAAGDGIPAAFAVSAVLLALPAPLYMLARTRPHISDAPRPLRGHDEDVPWVV